VITAGADVNAADISGMTPLHQTAYFNKPKLAELLLANGADAEAKNHDGVAPMHCVGSKEMAQLLLSHGAAINIRDNKGKAVLDHIDKKDHELEAFLREHGARTGTELNEEQKKGE
jgi:ankyrin repeat protein